MDSENISSPVDPDPKLPTASTSKDYENEINLQTTTAKPTPVVKSLRSGDILDDDDIDSILRQNQKFIEEHSIDSFLPDFEDKAEDSKDGDEVKEENQNTKEFSEILEEDIVVKESQLQLQSAGVVTEAPTNDENFELSQKSAAHGNSDLNTSNENKLEVDDENISEISKATINNDHIPTSEIVEIAAEEIGSFETPEETITSSDHVDTMAEEDKSFAPCAECKYRWSKVVDTSSTDIGFYPTYSKGDPILLSWDSALKAYYSVDQKIICGDYHGNIVVDGNVYPVELFNVRSYTFEVDLFIKEDVLDEETKPASISDEQKLEDKKQTNSTMDNSVKDESPTVSNPVAEKNEVTTQSTEDFINSVTSSLKFETLTKRHSPVGDDAVKSYSEFSPIQNGSEGPLNKSWNSNEKVKEEINKRPSSRISNQSGKQNDIVDDIIGDIPGQDLSRISNSSIHSQGSEERDVRNVRSSPGPSPVQLLSHNSARESPSTEAVYRRPSSNTSDRFSPARSGRPGSDVDSYDKDDQKAVISSLSRNTPTRDFTPTHSRHGEATSGRERIVENGDHTHGSRPPSHPSSRIGSNHSSRAQSLSSITSEQELGQYIGHGSRSSSIDRSGPTGANGHIEGYQSPSTRHRESDRPTSVPSYSQQQQNSDVRSLTPDNRIRVPSSPDLTGLRGAVLSDRMESESRNLDRASVHSNAGSRASSRTITPSFSEKENFSPRMRDLEDTIANLRKLLTKREAEVHALSAKISDLKDINRSLKDDLDHAKMHRPGTSEDTVLELKQTVAEKEILATEVVSLRDELQRLKHGSGRRSNSSEISDYSPNNPSVLQRKIVDLESHMRDLQEAHESATSKLGKAENKIRSLQDENKDLKSRSLSIADLQEVGGHNLRVEMVTLREDLRSLKERNFQLTEENMRLRESKDLGGHSENKLNSSYRSDDGVLRNQQNSHNYKDKNYRSSYSNYTESRSVLPNQYKINREDLAPKDSSYTSERKHHESSSRSLLQRENIEQSRLRYSPKKDAIHALEASKSSVLYADRSRPDGEISEKLQSQRVADLSSYDKRYLSREKSPRLHSNIHDFRPRDYSKDDRTGDRLLSDRYNSDMPERDYQSQSSGSALNSKEIFYNLKQKRANQWLQQDKYVSGNLEGQRSLVHRDSPRGLYTDDLADDSDTATDILLAQESGPRETSHIRVNSPDESLSSLSDGENGDSNRLRRRSKSVEFRRSQEGSSTRLLRSGSATRPLNTLDSSRNSSGLRSVLPAPLVTQHNKSNLSNSSSSLLNSTLTQGMRPFAPCNPSDVRSGDVVKFSRVGGKLTQGVVKYVGHLPGRSDAYLGVELDKDEGKHDGTFEGIRYFKCKPNKGVFVAFNKIVMAWAP